MGSSALNPVRSCTQARLQRRQVARLAVVAFILVVFLCLEYQYRIVRSYAGIPLSGPTKEKLTDLPPTWEAMIKWEAELPQHNLDLPFPEGRTGRYVKFTNQIKMLGWNNVLNEILMNCHLAYESQRSYVFQDYVWKPDYYPWPEKDFREWPPRTPLNALISGPAAGGPWEDSDNAPRAVSEKWFDVVCPEHERRIINTADVKPAIRWSQGDVIFDHWRTLLLEAPERCIEVTPGPREDDGFPQTFDLFLWGSDRILSMWERFSTSPTSRLLSTSPVVNAAVAKNEHLFYPRASAGPRPSRRDAYGRMAAMHIRRGDFKEACIGLATWNSTFYSWNLLPELSDPFVPPPGGSWGYNTPENTETYLERCLPTAEAIVAKAHAAREDFSRVVQRSPDVMDTMYLLTNERGAWLAELETALRQDGWRTIVTTKQLVLDQEQIDVNMAVDMDIARRAAVFIGNGWSSFTSNIVHRRMVDGNLPISTRFY